MQDPTDPLPPLPGSGTASGTPSAGADTRNAGFDESGVFDALWQTVADRGWYGVTFGRIAATSGVGLGALRGRYGTPHAMLPAYSRSVDQAVLAGTVSGQGGLARDRIFDLLMRRFDVLQPHRAGVLRLHSDLRRHPLLALSLSPTLMSSMAWMLEGAEVDTSGSRGMLRVQGLVGVWLATLRAWADDNSLDLSPTMAALDKALDRAEQVARTIRLDDGDLGRASVTETPIVPEGRASPSPPAATDPMLG